MMSPRSTAGHRLGRAGALLTLVVLVAACSTPRGTVNRSLASAAPTVTTAPLPACVPASQVMLPPGGARAADPIWTIASGLNRPDDLLVSDGTLLVAVLGTGSIEALSPGLPPTALAGHVQTIEGMVYLGGNLYVAGQAQDAIYELTAGQARLVLQLNPVPGQDGVDGIAAADGMLIVPDSPRGVIDWVDPSTGRITKQVGGMVRPTGVFVTPGGSLLVADEYGNAALELAPDGSRTYLVRGLPIVDDIAQDSQGNVFVVTPVITGGRLVQIAPGPLKDLADGLLAPQGLAVDGADNLYFSEEDAGRVDLVIRTFKLVPLRPVRDSASQPVCVDVVRAPGFDAPITLLSSPGVTVVTQPGLGNQAAVLVSGCVTTPCALTAVSGTWHDVLSLQAQGT